MMHIRVYLAIIVEGEDKMVVVFQVKMKQTKMKNAECFLHASHVQPLIYRLHFFFLLSNVEPTAEIECTIASVPWSAFDHLS